MMPNAGPWCHRNHPPVGITVKSAAGPGSGHWRPNDELSAVREPKVGAIVPYIPDSAVEHTGDKTTYTYNGITYQPVSLDGNTSYLVSSTG